jgi:hypothetical protein
VENNRLKTIVLVGASVAALVVSSTTVQAAPKALKSIKDRRSC